MLQLDHVAQRVLDDIATSKPADDYTEPMLELRTYYTDKNDSLSTTAQITFSIKESKKQSEILESLILSNCPEDIIEEHLAVPKKVVDWYKELFFDTHAFRTKLDVIEYITEYPDDFGRDLKTKAVNLGYEFVLFNFANLVPKTQSQKKLIERMFMATAYKAMAMNYNGIKTEVNKQAVKHAELMIKAYELLVKTNIDDTDTSYDLVKLLTTNNTKQIEQTIEAEEIV